VIFNRLHLTAINDTGQLAWYEDGTNRTRETFAAYQALWPSRYNRKRLDMIRQIARDYYWSAQYQQVPSMGDLSFFLMGDHIPRWTSPQVGCWIVAVDAANTATENGAETAFVAVGACGGRLKVIGARSGKYRVDAMVPELEGFIHDMERLTGIRSERVLIEMAAGGWQIYERLTGKYPLQELTPKRSKEDRAGDVAWLVNSLQVEFPARPSADVVKLEAQLRDFPLCTLKDLVDAFVWCLMFASGGTELKTENVEQTAVLDTLEMARGAGLLGDGSDPKVEGFAPSTVFDSSGVDIPIGKVPPAMRPFAGPEVRRFLAGKLGDDFEPSDW
jgi:hypothetical protein